MDILESSLEDLLKSSHNFHAVRRFPLKDAKAGIELYENDGLPVIIEGFHQEEGWPMDMFTPNWLVDHGPQVIHVRNIHNRADSTTSIRDFFEKSRAAPPLPAPEEEERLYGKDVECPPVWNEWLHKDGIIPSSLLPNSVDNLMQNLPKEHQVETLMCYLGIGGTFTPCHKDLCASSGQNLMCYTENDGSSIWTMTASSDAPLVSGYFRTIHRELDHENHVITMTELAAAPFTVYIAEQKLGDLVLVPRRSSHQVVNKGGLTIKTSWSRMTLKGLKTAYYHELPLYRRVCRPEIYRVKLTIYYNLLASIKKLEKHLHGPKAKKPGPARHNSLKILLQLFEDILSEEYTPDHTRFTHLVSTSASQTTDSTQATPNVTAPPHCDFCHGDIFQSFFECRLCVDVDTVNGQVTPGEGFAICSGCFVEGRTCKCGADMDPVQCRPFSELLQTRATARALLSEYTNNEITFSDMPPGLGVFHAACLQLNRNETDPSTSEPKSCSLPKPGHNHYTRGDKIIGCKSCRRGTCYHHLLERSRVHVVDALLLVAQDSSYKIFHTRHMNGLRIYNEGHDAYVESQRNGTKPDNQHQRVHLALEYRNCKPGNHHFAVYGWYDDKAKEMGEMSPEKNSPLSQNSTLSITVRESATSGSLNATPHKRKRERLDFVDMSDSSSNAKKRKDAEISVGANQNSVRRGRSASRPGSRLSVITQLASSSGSGKPGRPKKRAMAPFADSASIPTRKRVQPLLRSISDSSPLTPVSGTTVSAGVGGLTEAVNRAMDDNYAAMEDACTSTSESHQPTAAKRRALSSAPPDPLNTSIIREQASKLKVKEEKLRKQAETIRAQELQLKEKDAQLEEGATKVRALEDRFREKEEEVNGLQKKLITALERKLDEAQAIRPSSPQPQASSSVLTINIPGLSHLASKFPSGITIDEKALRLLFPTVLAMNEEAQVQPPWDLPVDQPQSSEAQQAVDHDPAIIDTSTVNNHLEGIQSRRASPRVASGTPPISTEETPILEANEAGPKERRSGNIKRTYKKQKRR